MNLYNRCSDNSCNGVLVQQEPDSTGQDTSRHYRCDKCGREYWFYGGDSAADKGFVIVDTQSKEE